NMWFPRMHSHASGDVSGYYNWTQTTEDDMYAPGDITLAVNSEGKPVKIPKGKTPIKEKQVRPTYLQNLQYFAVYQCAYMYWRYFMWNFVGRQNDYTGHGEPDAGNFITGIDALDRLMLDVVADAPANAGRENKARNVYFALPFILGIMGLVYQIRRGRQGRRQAMLTATLFFLTGMAIVVYLNQGPVQARDRDYAFLGSWYAFCIWIGLGTVALYNIMHRFLHRHPKLCAGLSVGLALCVPLQMLSQTYDDHDRSGRTAARDTACNMLVSTEPQAVIFSSQDNNIFPLWYMIEVEEMRPDVRIISYPYMTLAWYPPQWLMPMRESRPVEMTAPPGLLASEIFTFVKMGTDTTWTPAVEALNTLYTNGVKEFMADKNSIYPTLKTPRVYFTVGADTVRLDLARDQNGGRVNHLDATGLYTLDILATNAASKAPRPIYWTRPVGEDIFNGQLAPYLERIGNLTKFNPQSPGLNARKTADLALNKFKYGTAPGYLESGKMPYFDPVAANNLALMRSVLTESAKDLSVTGSKGDAQIALQLLELVESKMPEAMVPYQSVALNPEVYGIRRVPRYADEGIMAAETYMNISSTLGRPELKKKGETLKSDRIKALKDIERYRNSLRKPFRRFLTYRLSHMLNVLHPIPAPDTTSFLTPKDTKSLFDKK
ncbi:MAG: hypothetical protein NC548_51910, partial [Lachnospiraceae bacterium]|nr:hypothetical protein [Lachnospiraceae bacterium]